MTQETSIYFRRSAQLPHVEWRRADHSSACYHTHTHDEFSVGVIDAGTAIYRNRQQEKIIHQGVTVMVNPEEAHSCNPDAGQRWSYRMLFIDRVWMSQLQTEPSGLTGRYFSAFAFTSVDKPWVYQHFDDVFNTLEQDPNPLATDETLIRFLINDCFESQDFQPEKLRPEGHLERAKELIMDQLNDNVTLQSIADVSGLSPYHLIRRFKQTYGQTPHAFQLDQRINRAKQLLKLNHPIVEVAHQLGFSDQSHFQRHFKMRHAVTPKVYQRLNRTEPPTLR